MRLVNTFAENWTIYEGRLFRGGNRPVLSDMIFEKILIEDNDKYLQLLKQCKEIPSELATAYSFGYDEVFPGARAYEDGLCWHRLTENGREHLYPPVGNWDEIDWRHILPTLELGTRFEYVPAYLKDMWVRLFPDAFQISTDRGSWDYIYDIRSLVSLPTIRRLYRRFEENYRFDVTDITEENTDSVLSLTRNADREIRRKHTDSYQIMDEDDRAMRHVLRCWGELPTVTGILICIEGTPASYAIWEKIDDRRYVFLFNKSLYAYKGINEACTTMMVNRILESGGSLLNGTCDANAELLRQAKLERHPIRMVEKYTMIWKGNSHKNE